MSVFKRKADVAMPASIPTDLREHALETIQLELSKSRTDKRYPNRNSSGRFCWRRIVTRLGDNLAEVGYDFRWLGTKKIMIKNGLYTLTATALDGVDGEVGGVLILHDGKLYGGDSYVFYTGTYDCSHGKWKGEMTSQEHTPTKRPMAERHQHIGFSGTYNDTSAKADAKALVGEKSIRYDATLRLLVAV